MPIAEWVLAAMLGFEKRLPQSWLTEPPAQWNFADLGTLENKTLGLIGLGSIGREIARRALAFDMRVIAKVRTQGASVMPGVELVEELDEVLEHR